MSLGSGPGGWFDERHRERPPPHPAGERPRSIEPLLLGYSPGSRSKSWDERRRFAVGDTRVVLRSPLDGTPEDDRFSERRIGLDHISFGVRSRASLERLIERLRVHGVATAGIETNPDPDTEFVAFRDPDNIQLEFFVI
jgi:catechol 2,3-dioxygenase-like lactoylglutathione lyase family enzyme